MVIDKVREDALLDLLNTTPVVRGVVDDALAGPQGRQWALQYGGTGTAAELAFLTTARDALQRVVRGSAAPEDLQELLQDVSSTPQIKDGKLAWSLQAPDDRRLPVEMILAWAGVQEARPGRLRPCENPECRRFLLDRSKPNTARWCSMSECGNRMKARRHYQRVKDSTPR
ncbi:CGNR zinc finger domain-containing protein [Streptomyces nigra]|uniref:CGNR zinc finger domain-containing protein n=1 Tax=Streptomyces nigra TaxID=1827580 RepID=UPI0036A801C1